MRCVAEGREAEGRGQRAEIGYFSRLACLDGNSVVLQSRASCKVELTDVELDAVAFADHPMSSEKPR
jgi:hypothetical protein